VSGPLWQYFLSLFVVSFCIQRGAALAIAQLSALPSILVGAYALQIAIGLVTAVGIWMGRRWVLGALLALGTTIVCTTLLASFSLGLYPGAVALSRGGVAAVATGGLFWFLRYEFDRRAAAEDRPPEDSAKAGDRPTRSSVTSSRRTSYRMRRRMSLRASTSSSASPPAPRTR